MAEQLQISTSQLGKIRQISQTPKSLNAPYASNVGGSDDMFLEDYISDDLNDVVDHVCENILKDDIKKLLVHSLTSREIWIILYRYGFINGEELTLEELGEKFHITRQRVNQIEKKALRKLKVKATDMNLDRYI